MTQQKMIPETAEGDATAAEHHAMDAMKRISSGDLEGALRDAEAAAGKEMNWGDNPTWRPFLDAVEKFVEERKDG